MPFIQGVKDWISCAIEVRDLQYMRMLLMATSSSSPTQANHQFINTLLRNNPHTTIRVKKAMALSITTAGGNGGAPATSNLPVLVWKLIKGTDNTGQAKLTGRPIRRLVGEFELHGAADLQRLIEEVKDGATFARCEIPDNISDTTVHEYQEELEQYDEDFELRLYGSVDEPGDPEPILDSDTLIARIAEHVWNHSTKGGKLVFILTRRADHIREARSLGIDFVNHSYGAYFSLSCGSHT